MTKNYLLSSIVIVISAFTMQTNASYFRTLNYDDIRNEGGFASLNLRNVEQIIHSKTKLTDIEKGNFLVKSNLPRLRAIDLSNQDIDDNFVRKLCENKSLKRLISFDLSNNKKITNKSIDEILNSNVVGSVRDLPQISGRYGLPCSIIYVKAKNTGITPSIQNEHYWSKHRFNFNIDYLHILDDMPMDQPVDEAIKIVEVVLN